MSDIDKREADRLRSAIATLSNREASMLSYYLEACVLLDRENESCDNMVEIEALAGNELAMEASAVREKVCNYRGAGK